MNNNYNNGQFGGWGQNPYGANSAPNYDYFNEQYKKEQEKKQDKNVLKTLGTWFGLAILGYTGISSVVSLIIFLLQESVFPKLGKLFEDFYMIDAYQIVASIFFILLPFVVAHLVLKKKKLTGVLPFGTTYNKKAAISLTMLVLPVMLFSTLIINMISGFIQEMLGLTFISGMEDFKVIGLKGFILSTLATAILPAIIEELVIRGVVMQPLRRFGDTFAVVASAFVFAIMHGNMVQVPYTMSAGIFFGYLVVKTGSLWPAIVLHFINNFYSVVLMATYDNFGDNVGAVVTISLLGLFVIAGIIGGVTYNKMNYRMPFKKGVESLKTSEKIGSLFANVPMIMALVLLVIQTLNSIE